MQPQSLERIRELESLGLQQEKGPQTPTGEAPRFVTELQDISKLTEGQSAHFEARITPINDPDLLVEWYYNGKKLPHGHRFRTFHDFGIVILDILYCYEENSGEYECRASNKYGTAVTKASLRCYSKTNLILDSQLPRVSFSNNRSRKRVYLLNIFFFLFIICVHILCCVGNGRRFGKDSRS